MARTNQQHLERARAKLNALHDEIEQARPLVIAAIDKAIDHAKQQLAKVEAKLTKLSTELESK